MLRREALYFLVAFESAALPPLLHLYKFRTPTGYHTWSAKLAVFLMSSGVILLFVGWSGRLFHLATWLCMCATLEQIAMTLVLPQSRCNIPSFWHAIKEFARRYENLDTP